VAQAGGSGQGGGVVVTVPPVTVGTPTIGTPPFDPNLMIPQRAENIAIAFFVVVGSVLAGLVVAGARGELPWAPLLAVAPSWLVATTVAVKPPRPARLKTIGWTLLSASLTAALILVVVLSSPR
jgi:hypothetical protein